ncbi:hypothetical protein BV25DRAFT_1815305 [Artomyces pyxidatus]|uniref:Uncharacterized protein n=1 Tax=Artomyces pyxidatus TaxID=48021 RepID=A0ACB8SHX8_9AGAM|nr:hypothetical protein BV25DRAFT_1815305 [Artomyces pyxidatus]
MIVDPEWNVLAHLAGKPMRDETWDPGCAEAAQKMNSVRDRVVLSPEERNHRRGQFAALRAGISYGGGQTHPQNLDLGENEGVIRELLADPNIQRIVGFANSTFATGAPKLYKHYESNINALVEHDPTLEMPFSNSIHAAVTFNLGPRTVTKKHVDSGNLPNGWCAITPLGNFDASAGGHFVLHEFKLIIQFPANSTIHVPSGSVTHSNLPVQRHETRLSLTQYTAGPLHRWVAYGFRTEKMLARQDPAEKAQMDAARAGRWPAALRLFSKYEELEADIRREFGLPNPTSDMHAL